MSKFAEIVMSAADLPEWVRENGASAHDIESHQLDKSYLAFLDEQIALSPQGPEWTEVLKKRREALSAYCGKLLTSGVISAGKEHCYIKIDDQTEKILYWEIYEIN
jgi:hypothetical protein